MNRRILGGILTLALLLSATPWEAIDASSSAAQSDGLHALERVALAVDSCCVCLCLFTSSPLLPVLLSSRGTTALLVAPSGPLFPMERSFVDPPSRLVFHPPRRV